MNISIVGSNGFIGSNLKYFLKQRKNINILEIKRNEKIKSFKKKLKLSKIIFHLGGENRSKLKKNFYLNNFELSKKIALNTNKDSHIIYASTIKVNNQTPYGQSKKKAEKILKDYEKIKKYKLTILRLPNVFGRWSKPNYNSVVSTFCYNAARNKISKVNEPKKKLKLLYIDDLVNQLFSMIFKKDKHLYPKIKNIQSIKLVDLYKKIYSLGNARDGLSIDLVKSNLDKKIYSTYLSFIPEKKFILNFKHNIDKRGNFSELLKSKNVGQISYCTINPGQTRGNHFHFTKVERFFALHGKGKIIYKNIITKKEKTYLFDGEKPMIFETIPGWSHKLVNTTKSKAIFVLWTNENFDIKKPDTYFYNI